LNNQKYPWANKDLGQHFLINDEVILNICTNFHSDAKGIIEIGPGPGILTEHLAKISCPYTVIEKDPRFKPYLEKWISKDQVIWGDALEIDLLQLIETKNFPQDLLWMVSNLPYNISIPLILKFTDVPQIKYMTLMMQKEVAERILSEGKKASKSMNSLMALTQTFFDIQKRCHVEPTSFLPPPKVDSSVLSFVRKDDPAFPLSEIPHMETFFKKLFIHRRKQIRKVLKLHFPQVIVNEVLEKRNIDPTRRAETLTLQEVHTLYSSFSKN
jgi:16S rRNA (adenine1518-N6/adenine1519-N6)-dimethyltransferase